METMTLPSPAPAVSAETAARLPLYALRAAHRREIIEMFRLTEFQMAGISRIHHFPTREEHDFFFRCVKVLHNRGFLNVFHSPEKYNALHNMAVYYAFRMREPESWDTRRMTGIHPVDGLIRHLFAQYPVPDFLHEYWGRIQHSRILTWYLHIAQGGSWRNIPGSPIPVTRKMAHLLSQAPSQINEWQAIRWAHLTSLGASREFVWQATHRKWDEYEKMMVEPLLTWLAKREVAEGFTADVNEFMDYFQHEWLQSPARYLYVGEKLIEYIARGRSLRRLLGDVTEWHSALRSRKSHVKVQSWRKSKKPAVPEPVADAFAVWELTDSLQLAEESSMMQHCVRSYAFNCMSGYTRIFSLRDLRGTPVLTIELSVRSKELVQIRGKANRMATDAELDLLRTWAKRRGFAMR